MSKVIEQNDKEGSKGYFSFGGYNKGYSYKTATAFLENITSKREPDLFADFEQMENTAITSVSQGYMDKHRRKRSLSPFLIKMLMAANRITDIIKDREDAREYIKKLPIMIEDGDIDEYGISKRYPSPFICNINLSDFAKEVYSTNKIGGKQLESVYKGFLELSEIFRVFEFKDSRGGIRTIGAPFIQINGFDYYSKKEIKYGNISVTFGAVFFYEINERYSLLPLTYLKKWNETGVQTEFFAMLQSLILKVKGNFITHSKKIVAAEKARLKKENKSESEIERIIKSMKRETLTYKESLPSLLERIDQDKRKRYYKGKYLRLDNLKKDLRQAKDALLKIGMISDYYETTGASGEIICNFLINDMWILEESNKIKRLPYSPEEGSEEDITDEA